MESTLKKRAGIRLLALILLELALAAALVMLFDPFYQYHGPLPGMKAVLNDRDNQMAGTIRNFQYDSLLVGSSVAENFDSSYLDETYGCHSLKVIRASGSTADLLYYINMAQEKHQIKDIFWCLDLFALDAPVDVTLRDGDTPLYLHTDTILDDLPYLFNKEILLEKIPSMLAYSHEGIYVDGDAYNWSRDKEFSAQRAMNAYDRADIVVNEEIEQKDFSDKKELISRNIKLLTEHIAANPRIRYRFLIPPYSLLWWDCAYVNGELEERFYILEEVLPALLSFENVEVYYFQDEEEIVCDLDHYMDMIHYSPEVNDLMLRRMAAGENKVTAEGIDGLIADMRRLAERICTEEIFRYYPVRE